MNILNRYQHTFLFKSVLFILMGFGINKSVSADTFITKQTEQKEIQGYPPYMQSVGAELLTEVKDSDTGKITYFPWTLNDDNTVRGPTIGSIAYVPDIFCSVLNKDLAAAKTDASIGHFFDNFNFIDKDFDPCHDALDVGISVKWYMLDNVSPWNESLKWEELNPVEIPREYIIKAGSDVAKQYQLKHNFTPLLSKAVSLNVLDAVEIPTMALGKRIGFVLEPKSKYGLPTMGKPIKVWDLNHYFSQSPPSNAGELLEDHLGFILGPNPTDNADGSQPSTAGGIVQLGRPPYVRSIGAHYATNGYNIGYNADGTARTLELVYTGAQKENGGLPEARPRAGTIVYIPDAFCQFKNTDIETDAEFDAIRDGLGFPALKAPDLAANQSKLKYFRPYFWIADADGDSCDITSNQIEWFLVEPDSDEFRAFKAKVQSLIASNAPMNTLLNELEVESDTIWRKVQSWDDVRVVTDVSFDVIEPGRGGDYNFDAIGGNYLSAIKLESNPNSDGKITHLVRPAFIFTPKTKSGMPDTGRQIKVPYVASKLWGQRPSTRPSTLAEAQPNSDFIQNNPSGSGELISSYPQIVNASAPFIPALLRPDLFSSLTFFVKPEFVNFECLLDPKTLPAADCTKPLPPSVLVPKIDLLQEFATAKMASPRKEARALERAIQQPEIINLQVSGKIGLEEEITVTYTFVPKVSSDPFASSNRSRYEFGQAGTAISALNYSSAYAGTNLVQGVNSFKLRPLTQADLEQKLEVAVWALNDYYEGAQKQAISLDTLPKVTNPAVDDVKISSDDDIIMANSVLRGNYTFIPSDATKLTTDNSYYSWIGASAITDKPITESGKVDNYTVSSNDVGQVVTLSVTARDAANRIGNTLTDSVYPTAPTPSVNNVVITSKNEVRMPSYRATLMATYEFDSGIENNTIDKSTYGFYIGDEEVAKQTKTYDFTAKDLGKVITFKITPINSYNVSGSADSGTYLLDKSPPSVKNVNIIESTVSYSPFFFGMLTATYDYLPGISSDAAEDMSLAARTSNLNWSGGYTTNNSVNYVFGPNDIGRILTFSILPQDLSGQKGQLGLATYTMPVAPKIINLNINTDIFNSTTPYQVLLTGNYTYVPSTTSKPADNSTYEWSGLTTPASGAINNAVGSGAVPPISLVAADAGKLISLRMVPRDGNLWLGEEVVATTRAPSQLVPPKIANLVLVNTNSTRPNSFFVGDTIRANYTFTGSSVNQVDASKYSWTAASGNQSGIVSGPLTFLIKPADAGNIIRLDMEASDALGNIGNKENASTSAIISLPSLKDVNITAALEQTAPWYVSVIGSYTFIEGKSSNPTNNSFYSWTGINNPILNQPTTGASGPLVLPVLTLDKLDAGKVLTLTVTPRDLAGNIGVPGTATYTIPKPTIIAPKIENLTITNLTQPNTGRYLPNDELSASYTFIKGTESINDRSLFEWSGKSGITKGIIGTDSLRYTIKTADAGQLINLKMLAKDGAGIEGNEAFASIKEIVSSNPSITSVMISFKEEGSLTINGTYNFVPGAGTNNQDKSEYRWNVGGVAVSNFTPTITPKVVTPYNIKQADVGKLIVLEVLPKDEAGLVGDIKVSNSLSYQALSIDSLSISGQPTETQSLTGIASFTFGNNKTNKSMAAWYKNNALDKTLALNVPYQLVAADIGKVIGLRVTAVDGNNITGNTKIATDTKAVTPFYTPPFVDEVAIYYFNSRDLVLPGHFLGGSYKTFIEGSVKGDKSTYEWLSGATLKSTGDVGSGRSVPAYTISETDIGNVITLRITARDGNKNPGNTDDDQTIKVIAPPKVSNPIITYSGNPIDSILVNTQLSGRYNFTTGRVGATDASIVTWYVNNAQKQQSNITQSGVAPSFNITADYVGQSIKMEVTAADTLGTPGGNTVSVTSAKFVETIAPTIESLVIIADFEQSAIMTGSYIYKAGASANPADASTYEWLADNVVIQSGSLLGTNKIDGVNAYKVLTKDVGKTLRLKVTPTDKAGNKGIAVYSSNSFVYTAPKIKINGFNGTGEVNKLLSVNYTFTKGSNSKNTSIVEWTLVSGQYKSYVTANGLTPTDADVGKIVTVKVTAKDGNEIVGNTETYSGSITITENWPEADFIQIMTASSAVKPVGQWVEYDYRNPSVPSTEPDTTQNYRVDYVEPATGKVVSSRVFPVNINRHDNAYPETWQGGRDWYYGYENYTVCVYIKTTDKAGKVIQKGKRCFTPPHRYGYRRY